MLNFNEERTSFEDALKAAQDAANFHGCEALKEVCWGKYRDHDAALYAARGNMPGREAAFFVVGEYFAYDRGVDGCEMPAHTRVAFAVRILPDEAVKFAVDNSINTARAAARLLPATGLKGYFWALNRDQQYLFRSVLKKHPVLAFMPDGWAGPGDPADPMELRSPGAAVESVALALDERKVTDNTNAYELRRCWMEGGYEHRSTVVVPWAELIDVIL